VLLANLSPDACGVKQSFGAPLLKEERKKKKRIKKEKKAFS
jgi:hypothetical protein